MFDREDITTRILKAIPPAGIRPAKLWDQLHGKPRHWENFRYALLDLHNSGSIRFVYGMPETNRQHKRSYCLPLDNGRWVYHILPERDWFSEVEAMDDRSFEAELADICRRCNLARYPWQYHAEPDLVSLEEIPPFSKRKQPPL